jgi:hypothetical protein
VAVPRRSKCLEKKRRIEVVRLGEQPRPIINIGWLVWVEGSIVQKSLVLEHFAAQVNRQGCRYCFICGFKR